MMISQSPPFIKHAMIFIAFIAMPFGVLSCGQTNLEDDLSAGQTPMMRLGDSVVARVDGTDIYESDVKRLAIERNLIKTGDVFPQSDARFLDLIEELVDQRLLALGAVRRALDQSEENKRRLAAARERILGNILVEDHLRQTVNETSIRRMYDEQAALVDRGDEIRARHILLSDEASANAALKSLEEGADFAELAKSISLDEGSRETGGNLGYFTRDMLDPAFTDVVFNTPEGDRTTVFQTVFGWHVAEVMDRRPAQKQSFESLRPNIVKFMTFDEIQSLVESLRAEGEIEILIETSSGEMPEENVETETETDVEESED